MTVRIGFLGTGFIAAYHAAMLERGGADAVIVAVHDLEPERARRFAEVHGATAMATPDAVIDAADAVYVTTWTSAHRDLVERVVAAGRAVFCEKPLATDLAGAEAMVTAVERAGVVNQVGLVLRDSPSFLLLTHLVRHPMSGRLLSIVFRDDQYLPTQGIYGSDWRADVARAGGGTLLEHSIHDLDLLDHLAGPITAVAATTASVHGLDGIDDLAVAVLTGAGGSVSTLTSVWHDVLARPSMRYVEVFCERAVYVLEGDVDGPVRWTIQPGEGGAADEELDDDGGTVDLGDGNRRVAAGAVAGEELRVLVAALGLESRNPDAAFVDSVIAGRTASPTMADALEAHRLADAAYRSAAAATDGVGPVIAPDRGQNWNA